MSNRFDQLEVDIDALHGEIDRQPRPAERQAGPGGGRLVSLADSVLAWGTQKPLSREIWVEKSQDPQMARDRREEALAWLEGQGSVVGASFPEKNESVPPTLLQKRG